MFDLLAFDIGGTQGRCGIVRMGDAPNHAETLAYTTLRRAPAEDGAAWLVRLLAAARELGFRRQKRLRDFLFGGPVLPERFDSIPHVPGWERLDLPGEIERAFGIARENIHIENDANAGALGEQRLGAGRGCRNMLFVTVSTGIGGGVILNGQLHRGAHGLAGEFGHMILDGSPDAPQYAAGKRGALEAFASGPAIARDAAQALKALGKNVPAELDGARCFRCSPSAMKRGRAKPLTGRSANLLAAWRQSVARSMSNASSWAAVSRLRANRALLLPLRSALDEYLPSFYKGLIDVRPAELGDRAPMLGAAIACAEAHYKSRARKQAVTPCALRLLKNLREDSCDSWLKPSGAVRQSSRTGELELTARLTFAIPE